MFQSGDQWVANVNGTTRATQVLGTPLPPIDVTGSYDAKGFAGHATVHEPGIPLKASFDVHPDGSIDGSVEAKGVDLSRAPRLQPYFDGHGAARLAAEGAHRQRPPGDPSERRPERLSIRAGVHREQSIFGPRDRALGRPAKALCRSFGPFAASARGRVRLRRAEDRSARPGHPPVVSTTISNQHGPQITAKATITPRHATRIDDLSVEVRRDQAALVATVAEVDVAGDRVRVSGLRMEGAGGKLEARVSSSRRSRAGRPRQRSSIWA